MTGLSSLLLAGIVITAAAGENILNPLNRFTSSIGSGISNQVAAIAPNGDKNSVSQFAQTVGKELNIGSKSNESESSVGKFSKAIGKEIEAGAHAIEQPIVSIGSSQCSNVKKLLGVAYEQIEGEKEPDLNQLALEFIDNSIRIIYNITSAAKLVPLSRGYNPHNNLYIFIHGFTDAPTKSSFGNISTALLSRGECNVLALDGSELIKWLYLRSTTYIRFMGEKLGETLASMAQSGVDPRTIHIIGHSLGAHIASFTGKSFQELTGFKVARITGLDPAGPCFSHVDPELRLKSTDAEFVDVIHTDIGVYGLKDAIGHTDFYPNSGSNQPNCVSQSCSHSRAWQYFAESVSTPDVFPAVKCKDWDSFKKGECDNSTSLMGFACDPSTRGAYFLQTADDPPYGKGQAGLKFEDNEAIIKKITSLLGK